MAIQAAMTVSTTFDIEEGRRIHECKGMVRGIIVRAPTIGQGILGGSKSIIGGQIGAYTDMYEQARHVGVRYDASDVGGDRSAATEVLCYGTAAVLE